jgi:serine/threonine-protein kinase HipA
LRVDVRNGRNMAMFEYADEWRAAEDRFDLEPALGIGQGVFYPERGREIFGSLGDSAPDTWGRSLMQRMERRTAAREGRALRTLTEADYLLGVADVVRLGALRFRRAGEREFQQPLGATNTVPPLIEVPRLLGVTERVVRDEETDEDLLLLFAPGSSLGGARPKASVVDRDGHLAIAKFPKEGDGWNIGAWEEVGLRLAKMAGVDTSEHRLVPIAGKSCFLSRRFDRAPGGARIPFLSAMSMLNRVDGDRGSYPEIVEALRTVGARAKRDAEELFRRMVVNILLSNVDDHLRNHGFLRRHSGHGGGWVLSPAYDINPMPHDVRPLILSTNIDLTDGTGSIDLARASADYFDLDLRRADTIIQRAAKAVSTWRAVASDLGIVIREIDRMASAFEHGEMAKALKLGRSVAATRPARPASSP